MNVLIWAAAFFILALDQASKLAVLRAFNLNEPSSVIKNFFYLTLTHNTGAAFGLFKNGAVFFIVTSSIAAAAIAVFLVRRRDPRPLRDFGFALILGGALGNLLDRLRFGYVIDFLDFRVWPVFNAADSAITVGAALVIMSLCIRYYSK